MSWLFAHIVYKNYMINQLMRCPKYHIETYRYLWSHRTSTSALLLAINLIVIQYFCKWRDCAHFKTSQVILLDELNTKNQHLTFQVDQGQSERRSILFLIAINDLISHMYILYYVRSSANFPGTFCCCIAARSLQEFPSFQHQRFEYAEIMFNMSCSGIRPTMYFRLNLRNCCSDSGEFSTINNWIAFAECVSVFIHQSGINESPYQFVSSIFQRRIVNHLFLSNRFHVRASCCLY